MVSANGAPVLLLGGGGHARICYDLLTRLGWHLLGYVAPQPEAGWDGLLPYVGDDEAAMRQYLPDRVVLVNGVGAVPHISVRRQLFDRWRSRGYAFLSIVHDSAVVSGGAHLGEGAQIMAGAIVQVSAVIGRNTIVNTRASVDHECVIGDHVHLAPGAVVCGGVTIEEDVFIGAGATVIQGVRIGAGSVVGAGAVVVRDVPPGATVYGVPAKER